MPLPKPFIVGTSIRAFSTIWVCLKIGTPNPLLNQVFPIVSLFKQIIPKYMLHRIFRHTRVRFTWIFKLEDPMWSTFWRCCPPSQPTSAVQTTCRREIHVAAPSLPRSKIISGCNRSIWAMRLPVLQSLTLVVSVGTHTHIRRILLATFENNRFK